jgi:peptide deformylase
MVTARMLDFCTNVSGNSCHREEHNDETIMSLLKVLKYPDPRLRNKAKPVESFDGKLSEIVDDMFETMYTDNGVGLAATQVAINMRIFVADPQDDSGQKPFHLINPEITLAEGHFKHQEGCLSVPGIYEKVERANHIIVKAFDKNGEVIEMEKEGFHAVIIQHELDHLNGKLFIDYLSPIKRERARKALAKENKKK